jgi:hypothetical protein
MIIVHVAIVSGCLLAANNPSTSAGIVGSGHEALEYRPAPLQRAPSIHSTLRQDVRMTRSRGWEWKRIGHLLLGWNNAYETEFQPVSLWVRGRNKMDWIKRSRAYRENHQDFQEAMRITRWGWILKILIPALVLIVLPPATGGVVAYFTPPEGVGCRALSFILYAVCQVVTTILTLIRCAVEDSGRGKRVQYFFTGWRFYILSALFWFGSLMAAVGGTTMQIVGIYRNCICAAGAKHWWNINKVNPPINLATDTIDARNASIYWIWMGSLATVFMALTAYIGWWYQRLIRKRFTDAVKEMYIPDTIEGVAIEWGSMDSGGAPLDHSDSMEVPLLPSNDDAERWGESTARALRYSMTKPDRDISPMTRQSMESRLSYSGSLPYDERGEAIALSSWASPVIPRKPVSPEYIPREYM